jgi:adenylate cyclase
VGIEIERKFLVRGSAWRDAVAGATHLVQGYLGGDACSVRVRIEGDEARLNVKSRVPGMRRTEFEYPLPRADADEMLARFCAQRVEKRRHRLPAGPHVWEIDEFMGDNAGLVVAEIELGDEGEAFARPGWLGPEVTDDVRYYNVNLIAHPFVQWADRDAVLDVIATSP